MKKLGFLALLFPAFAFAYQDGETHCSTKHQDVDISIKTISASGAEFPLVEIQKTVKKADGTEDASYFVKGPANQIIYRKTNSEVLALGNLQLELLSGRPDCSQFK